MKGKHLVGHNMNLVAVVTVADVIGKTAVIIELQSGKSDCQWCSLCVVVRVDMD